MGYGQLGMAILFACALTLNYHRGRGTGLPLRGGGERRTGDCCEENLSMQTCAIHSPCKTPVLTVLCFRLAAAEYAKILAQRQKEAKEA